MLRKFASLALMAAALVTQSCTIVYYQLTKELDNGPVSRRPCDFKYSLNLSSGISTDTFGYRNDSGPVWAAAFDRYRSAISEVLRAEGCHAEYAGPADANFEIKVRRMAYLSALPQEWLTGLSVGLIPSWGTRPSQYVYSFAKGGTGDSQSYNVDAKSFSHLILFPFFWINFFMPDEIDLFKEAFRNYLEHS